MTHTKGPWQVDPRDVTGEGDLIITTTRGRSICEVHNHANAEPDDVNANAALIATAPDLLESLQWTVRALEIESGKLYKAHIDRAHAVINRATRA